jgi:hypothetical protein
LQDRAEPVQLDFQECKAVQDCKVKLAVQEHLDYKAKKVIKDQQVPLDLLAPLDQEQPAQLD